MSTEQDKNIAVELETLWNSQADEYNQFDSLGLDEMLNFAMAVERQRCLDSINKYIKPGQLQGNGVDDTAQRNGIILACNILMERIRRFNNN